MKKIALLAVAFLALATYAAPNTRPQKQDSRLYSLDQFFKTNTAAFRCVGKRLYGKAVVLSSEPDPKIEGKFIVTLGEVMYIEGRNRDYFRILKTKRGKTVYARLFFKVRISEAGAMRVREGQVFSVKGRVGGYEEKSEKRFYPNDNLYENDAKCKFDDDFMFHGFYLFIPEGGELFF